MGNSIVIVGNDRSFRRAHIGLKCASVWNTPGRNTIVGLGLLVCDRFIVSTYENQAAGTENFSSEVELMTETATIHDAR